MPPSHVQRVTDVMASLSKADSFWLTAKREVAWQTKFSTLFFHLIAPRCTALAVLTIRGNIAHSQGLSLLTSGPEKKRKDCLYKKLLGASRITELNFERCIVSAVKTTGGQRTQI